MSQDCACVRGEAVGVLRFQTEGITDVIYGGGKRDALGTAIVRVTLTARPVAGRALVPKEL
jgi:hypothetical protein